MEGYLNPSITDSNPAPHQRTKYVNQSESPNVCNSDAYLNMQQSEKTGNEQFQRNSNNNNHSYIESVVNRDDYLNPRPSQYSPRSHPQQISNFNNREDPIRANPDGYLHPRPSKYQQNQHATRHDKQDSSPTSSYLNARPSQYEIEPRLQAAEQTGSKTRFDSGVADLEMHRISSLPRTSSSYEYVDSNHYEEVPTLQRHQVQPFPDPNITGSSVLTDPTSDTDDSGIVFRSVKRKYTNPLYNRMVSAASSFFSEDKNSTKQIDTLERQLFCHCLVMLILFIVLLGTLALCIYLMIGQSNTLNNNELLLRIQKLEEENKKLYTNSPLKTNNSVFDLRQIYVNQQQIEFTYKNLSSQLNSITENLQQQIQFTYTNISSELNSITDNLQQQIHNVSQMEGPPGVGNLSACFYSKETAYGVGSDISSTTPWKPDLADLSIFTVMSSSCSVDGGTSDKLEVQAHTAHLVQYRCRCNGQISGVKTRECTLHLVICPRYS